MLLVAWRYLRGSIPESHENIGLLGIEVFLTIWCFCVIIQGVRLRIGASLKYRADGP